MNTAGAPRPTSAARGERVPGLGLRAVTATMVATLLLAACGTQTFSPGAQETVPPVATSEHQESTDAAGSTGDAAGVTAEVPAPGGDDISDVVPVEDQEILDEVAWTEDVEVDDTAVVQIVNVTEITGEAQGPGEIGGNAIEVTVQLSNVTDESLALNGVTVTAQDEAGRPLAGLEADPAEPFVGTLEPSEDAQGVYVFGVPAGATLPVTFTVNYAPEAPVAVFVGALS